jgi:RNA polymerase sigma-70 factor (ECF subfamily)
VTAKNRNVELPDEEHLQNLLAAAPDPYELLSQKSTMALLERAIARLPQDMREAIVLARLEELSLEEVAAVLNVPVGTVKSRLSRAKERLLMDMDGHLS